MSSQTVLETGFRFSSPEKSSPLFGFNFCSQCYELVPGREAHFPGQFTHIISGGNALAAFSAGVNPLRVFVQRSRGKRFSPFLAIEEFPRK